MHLRKPGVIISISENQDHTLKSPIWSKPAADCLLGSAGHSEIITLLSCVLAGSSAHLLAVWLFQAHSGIILGWLSCCMCGCVQHLGHTSVQQMQEICTWEPEFVFV